jgi:hypothetical protein
MGIGTHLPVTVLYLGSECAPSAPLPKCQNVTAILATQFAGDDQKRPVDCRPVIPSQFDQPGFLHQPTEFDQMAGAFAALHYLFPRVGAALTGFNAVHHCFGAFDRPQRQLEFRDQSCVIARERMLRQLLAKPPVLSHPWF